MYSRFIGSGRQLFSTIYSTVSQKQRRQFNVHEHTAMSLLRKNGILVPDFELASSADEVYTFARELERRTGRPQVMLKAQVLAGGRSRGEWSSGLAGGGVRLAAGADEARLLAQGMLGHRLRTRQTGPEGRPCHRLLVVEPAKPVREFYLAVAMDTGGSGGPILMAARLGGTGIEEAASSVVARPLGPEAALSGAGAAEVAERVLGLAGREAESAARFAQQLCRMFSASDATLLEVNPAAVDSHGQVLCLDCKLNVDSNARFRQPELCSARDWAQEDPRDATAAGCGLKYVGMDGDIGCLVNGAGLAMATMDIVKLHGGEPANFLDVGGTVTAKQVAQALDIIGSDGRVTAALVNIFGGIVRCDVVAEGLVSALQRLRPGLPVVVRLQGNRGSEARQLLRRESGAAVSVCECLDEAARMVRTAESLALASLGGFALGHTVLMVI
uniref:Succinyl-CoA synthetase beta chain n=1 Tax=Macrostomum lignano TaxID=282301 RepID=A0A1I8IJ86_9PLAT